MPCISEFDLAVNVIIQGCSWRMEGTFNLDSNKGTYAEGFSVSGGFMGDIVFNGGKLFRQ